MLKLYVWLKDLLRSERGQDMVEYGLITVLISAAIVLAVLIADLPGAFEAWADGVAGCISDSTGTACPF